jgi:hypothetical protein
MMIEEPSRFDDEPWRCGVGRCLEGGYAPRSLTTVTMEERDEFRLAPRRFVIEQFS